MALVRYSAYERTFTIPGPKETLVGGVGVREEPGKVRPGKEGNKVKPRERIHAERQRTIRSQYELVEINTPYVVPPEHGQPPVIAIGLTAMQSGKLVWAHSESLRERK